MGAGAIAVPAAPDFTLVYAGANISRDVSAMVTALEYVDELGGASGSATVTFEDRDGRWRNQWRPERGDEFSLTLGYAGGPVLECGVFQVDEIELRGVPDTVHMRGIETSITPDLRTERSLGYENMTLAQIAAQVASRHGLTVVGAPATTVSYSRITQSRESDLAFLRRMADEHGYEFSIRGSQLIFYARSAIEAAAPAATLRREQCASYAFKLPSMHTFKAATLTHFDPEQKQLIAATAVARQPAPTGDTLRVTTQRVENGAQAAARAQAQLHRANAALATAQATVPGDPRLVAGQVLTLAGFGAGDGNYLCERATHRIERASGYVTSLKLRSAAP